MLPGLAQGTLVPPGADQISMAMPGQHPTMGYALGSQAPALHTSCVFRPIEGHRGSWNSDHDRIWTTRENEVQEGCGTTAYERDRDEDTERQRLE